MGQILVGGSSTVFPSLKNAFFVVSDLPKYSTLKCFVSRFLIPVSIRLVNFMKC